MGIILTACNNSNSSFFCSLNILSDLKTHDNMQYCRWGRTHVGWGHNGTVTGVPLYLPCWVRPQWCCCWCPTCICHVGWGHNGAVYWCPPVSAMLGEATMVLLLVSNLYLPCWLSPQWYCYWWPPVSAMLGEATMVLLPVSKLYLPCWVRPQWCCYWCPLYLPCWVRPQWCCYWCLTCICHVGWGHNGAVTGVQPVSAMLGEATMVLLLVSPCICHVGWGQNGAVTGVPLYLTCWVRPQWCCYWWPLYLPCWVRPQWCCYWCPPVSAMLGEATMVLLLVSPCICHVGWGHNGTVTGVPLYLPCWVRPQWCCYWCPPVSAMLGEATMVLLLVSPCICHVGWGHNGAVTGVPLYLPCWVRPQWCCYWCPPVSAMLGEATMVLLLVTPCICHVGWGQNGAVTGVQPVSAMLGAKMVLLLVSNLYLPCWVRPQWCCYWCPPVSAMLGEATMVLLLVSHLYLPCWVRPQWCCYWWPPVSAMLGEATMVLLLVSPCICHVGWGQNGAVTGVQPVSAMLGATMVLLLVSNLYLPCWVRPQWCCYWCPPVSAMLGEARMVLLLVSPCIWHVGWGHNGAVTGDPCICHVGWGHNGAVTGVPLYLPCWVRPQWCCYWCPPVSAMLGEATMVLLLVSPCICHVGWGHNGAVTGDPLYLPCWVRPQWCCYWCPPVSAMLGEATMVLLLVTPCICHVGWGQNGAVTGVQPVSAMLGATMVLLLVSNLYLPCWVRPQWCCYWCPPVSAMLGEATMVLLLVSHLYLPCWVRPQWCCYWWPPVSAMLGEATMVLLLVSPCICHVGWGQNGAVTGVQPVSAMLGATMVLLLVSNLYLPCWVRPQWCCYWCPPVSAMLGEATMVLLLVSHLYLPCWVRPQWCCCWLSGPCPSDWLAWWSWVKAAGIPGEQDRQTDRRLKAANTWISILYQQCIWQPWSTEAFSNSNNK